MTTLKAPVGVTSCSVNGAEFAVVDGLVDIPSNFVDAAKSHGFADYTPPVDDGAAADAPPVAGTLPADMTRKQLFAFLRERGIAVMGTTKDDKLRELVTMELDEDAKKNADALKAEQGAAEKAKAEAAGPVLGADGKPLDPQPSKSE